MLLEQFDRSCLQRRYVYEILMIHFIYKLYFQTKQKLGGNVIKRIVASKQIDFGGEK